ncbi:MAG: insulinase family protein [Candidatus Promineifilaceae bacterium]|nr:insulinase family protein [Candidatus Promineifilaceae bacterium]
MTTTTPAASGTDTETGFTLVREEHLPELNLDAHLYRHQATGAELLALINDDRNKTFGVTFRTLPEDSTGLPHILEHSVLGGSEKYPVKEPFLQMVKGSLATFINAWTGADMTSYPVASKNLQDFYNLMEVYLDAAFHPILARHTFDQEGWHFELEDEEDELGYRGIVFNEMKGALSSPDMLIYAELGRHLFPDTGYRHFSGGDPSVMPDLTYEQLVDFHARHYNPANARFFLYGDLPLEEVLERLDDFLDDYEARKGAGEPAPVPELQSPFGEPRTVSVPYQATENGQGKKGYVLTSWALPEDASEVDTLTRLVLFEALVGSQASPLRRALLDSGLGEDVLDPLSWLGVRQPAFATGLRGVPVERLDEVETLVVETLRELGEEGLDPATVDAALNTVEFRLRENNAGGFGAQQGLTLMVRAMNRWIYGGDPIERLAFAEPLEQLKAQMEADPDLLTRRLRTLLLDNPHRLTMKLEPDPALGGRLQAEEAKRLQEIDAELSPAQRQEIVENTRKLKELQARPDAPEALETLPMLDREDLEREQPTTPRAEHEVAGVRAFHHPLPTNGILYLDLGFNLRTLPQELLPYAALFAEALLKMGTESEDVVAITQRIGAQTGGIRPALVATPHADADSAGPVYLFLRGKATLDNADNLLDILSDLLLGVNLNDKERFLQIVRAEKAQLEASLIPQGYRFVMGRLRAHFEEAAWANEQMTGIAYLTFLRELEENIADDWESVRTRLEGVRYHLLNRNVMLVNITVDAEAWEAARAELGDFLEALPATDFKPQAWTMAELPRREGFIIPGQVNYVGKAGDLYASGYERSGAGGAVSRYLARTWLWEKIRAEGGAYGAPAALEPRSGIFTFASYRDPNLERTLDVYERSGQYLRDLELDEDELTRAILGGLNAMDPAQQPDAEGFSSLTRALAGESDALRQQERDELLELRRDAFPVFGQALDEMDEAAHLVILAPGENLHRLDEAHGGDWIEIRRLV